MDSDLFPLRTIGDVRTLFERHLKRDNWRNVKMAQTSKHSDDVISGEPNLVLLSIVAGSVENNMTMAKTLTSMFGSDTDSNPLTTTTTSTQVDDQDVERGDDVTPTNMLLEPPLDWSVVESLMKKFDGIIRGFCDVEILVDAQKSSDCNDDESFEKVRKLIKHVADIIWNTLSKSHYKDKPHLQSIYSYLTGNKLDCFGVAFAVVAACQLLQVPNVHLALSEDHAWVVFGPDGTQTAEVTWHGKGNEDKRGRPVDIVKAKTSWLYLAGQPVVCDRYIEVAAIVSSINPSVNSNCDSMEVGALQQELLWLLYDMGHLKTYPMALGNLGDLEEISPSLGRPSCKTLFHEAINANVTIYNNHHVYPYTYQAGYFYRSKEYEKALEVWAEAADVIKLYRYSKDDEEIYKEFMEIANELIPSIVKTTSGDEILNDPKCFGHILRFYDGLCSWEEGSPTPVLHIGWAKHMVATCSKFSPVTRAGIQVEPEDGDDVDDEDRDEDEPTAGKLIYSSLSPSSVLAHGEDNNNYYKSRKCDNSSEKPSPTATATVCDNFDSQSVKVKQVKHNGDVIHKNNDVIAKNDDVTVKNNDVTVKNECQNEILIEKLSNSSAMQIFNIDFLLGKTNQPFLESTNPKAFQDPSKRVKNPIIRIHNPSTKPSVSDPIPKIMVKLNSAKMRGLRNLLCAEKLNTSAITLQMTAQSQTDVTSHHRKSMEDSGSSRSKRPRRD